MAKKSSGEPDGVKKVDVVWESISKTGRAEPEVVLADLQVWTANEKAGMLSESGAVSRRFQGYIIIGVDVIASL